MMTIDFLNFEPPLSIATRLSSPANMIAIPASTNQSVSVLMCRGNAKLIFTIPKRIIMYDTILMNAIHNKICSFVLVDKLQ